MPTSKKENVIQQYTMQDLHQMKRDMMESILYGASLKDFIAGCWHVIEPGVEYTDGWFIDCISEHMTAVRDGQIKRLNINIPPRHMKSIMVSIAFPCWVWTTQPDKRFITSSYALALSNSMSRRRRLILESDWYKRLWGDVVQLAKDQNAKGSYENTSGGGMFATSTGGSVTGFGADFLVADDLLNAMDSGSGATREAANMWFNEAFCTRLNNQKTGAIVNVSQRLHENDIPGMLMELGGTWESLVIPARYEGKKTFSTSLAYEDPRNEENEALWKERIGKNELDKLETQIGPQSFASQFQQRPTPAGGQIFKTAWIRHYTTFDDGLHKYYQFTTKDGTAKTIDENDCQVFVTADLAITKNTTSDYTVVSVWALTPDCDLILIDMLRDRLDNPQQIALFKDAFYRYSPSFMAIESVGYQLSVVQQLLQQGIPVVAYSPNGKGDKVVRATPAAVMMGNGKVYFPKHVHFSGIVVNEMAMFPLGSHDDFVDTLSMAAYYMSSMVTPSVHLLDDDIRGDASKRHTLDQSFPTFEEIEDAEERDFMQDDF